MSSQFPATVHNLRAAWMRMMAELRACSEGRHKWGRWRPFNGPFENARRRCKRCRKTSYCLNVGWNRRRTSSPLAPDTRHLAPRTGGAQ